MQFGKQYLGDSFFREGVILCLLQGRRRSRSRLEDIIDLRHELVQLGHAIDWSFFDDAYEAFYSEEGRPGIPTRMMVGLHILKHMFNLSDDGVCERWAYDPYFQF